MEVRRPRDCSGLQRKGRATIETLWYGGKCVGVGATSDSGRSLPPDRERICMLEAMPSSEAELAGTQRIAVLVPCYNEEISIAKVVGDFRAALPTATVYVYDNNSSDRTAEVAAAAGAVVRREPRQGKGRVVRRMFTDVDADLYVLVDGDATYDAP